MNSQYSKRVAILISLMMLCSLAVRADQAPDPDAPRKQVIDHMHHKLQNDQAPFKVKEAQALKELNEMTIREDVRIEEVNAKIDELMAAKSQIMRLRYDHLIEMRAILTDEQKINYDRSVLTRSAVQ